MKWDSFSMPEDLMMKEEEEESACIVGLVAFGASSVLSRKLTSPEVSRPILGLRAKKAETRDKHKHL